MPLTRFAPAPTGLLHLGHVANAIHIWGLAARHDAHVLLRIEDHDRQRSRPAYEAAILEDLDWLGFHADRFPTQEFRAGPTASRQSDRGAIYDAAVHILIARGLVYGCTCSRKEQSVGAADDARAYPGTCRDRGIPLTGEIAWRLRLEPGVETFDDVLTGPHVQHPARDFGDPIIRDRRGNWTYQFAVSVDDLDQGVDLVIRGEDLLASTGLQILIGRMLGRTAPARFAHHPLIMKSADQKLSKSDGDTGISELRARGWTPANVIGLAAQRVGLLDDVMPIDARDAGRLFDA